MMVYEREYICPKFCRLPEIIKSNIPNLAKIIEAPLNINTKKGIYRWCLHSGYFGDRCGRWNSKLAI